MHHYTDVLGIIPGAHARCRASLPAARSSCRARASPRSRGRRGLESAGGLLCAWGPGSGTPGTPAGSRRGPRSSVAAGFHQVLEAHEGSLPVLAGEALHADEAGRPIQELALEPELAGVRDHATVRLR